MDWWWQPWAVFSYMFSGVIWHMSKKFNSAVWLLSITTDEKKTWTNLIASYFRFSALDGAELLVWGVAPTLVPTVMAETVGMAILDELGRIISIWTCGRCVCIIIGRVSSVWSICPNWFGAFGNLFRWVAIAFWGVWSRWNRIAGFGLNIPRAMPLDAFCTACWNYKKTRSNFCWTLHMNMIQKQMNLMLK